MADSLSPADCARMLEKAESIVALTGAGISTAAGIPDFRGPQGLYVTRRYDPSRVFDIDAFIRDPEPFYEFTRDFLSIVDDIRPTLSHRFLARLEEQGRLKSLITQNIDALHHRAGSENVIAIHGDYWISHCLKCRAELDFENFRRKVEEEAVPRCENCGGLIKPDVVFFGEPVKGMDRAIREIERADLMLVLGSSLTVYPAAALPSIARCPVIVVNLGEVKLDPGPNRHFVNENLDTYLEAVGKALGHSGN